MKSDTIFRCLKARKDEGMGILSKIKPTRGMALCAAIATTILWSGTYIVNKAAFAEGVDPMTLYGLRYTLAGLVLMLFLRKRGPGRPMPMKYVIGHAILCCFIGQGFQSIGQKLLTPTLTSLIVNCCMVLIIMAADFLVLKEAPGKSIFIKVPVMLLGMLLYYQPWQSFGEPIDPKGVIILVIGSFGAAMNTFMNRYMIVRKGIESTTLTTRPMLLGGVMMLIYGIATTGLPRMTGRLVLCLLYLVFVSGALGFFLWVWSQKTLTSPQSVAINSAMIIEAALLDVIFLNRQLSLLHWAGLYTVFFAIVWIQMRDPVKTDEA